MAVNEQKAAHLLFSAVLGSSASPFIGDTMVKTQQQTMVSTDNLILAGAVRNKIKKHSLC